MATQTFERRTGWCGIAFVVLAATSGALAVSTGGSGDTVQEITSYYADETKQLLLIVGAQFVLQVLWLLVVAVRMARGARVVERAARGAALGSV